VCRRNLYLIILGVYLYNPGCWVPVAKYYGADVRK
jgi:hypothetical protein